MIFLNINELYEDQITPSTLENTAGMVLKEYGPEEEPDLTIAIEDNEQLHKLNLEFLGVDDATDVLSFPAEETDPDSGNLYIGDIIISFPKAAGQAQTAGHSIEAEIQLLVVHGVLHLLGYDHATPEEKKEMWDLQAKMIERLKIPIKKLPED
jgi:probable rRNA maturation factor